MILLFKRSLDIPSACLSRASCVNCNTMKEDFFYLRHLNALNGSPTRKLKN